ncbi:PRC-barrel domain-containing protein [Microvirga sp. GCM10011540]|uniref:PRC-barrel domain-containing protein n=1 Tax=Microvirga sp. GCM10011540 TaxID=3317338 RepID=UPI00361AC002
MLKRHMAACLAASALFAAPALAQTSPTAPATNTAPVTTPAGPAGSTMGANPNAAMGANSFITQREPGMYRASELIGTDVRGANNEDIGEVGDVLIDSSGRARAVVVDIGGFLGIGETHVAIPMDAVQFGGQQNATATGSVGGTAGTTGTTTGGATTMGGAGQNTAARTGNNQQGMAGGANASAPDMIVVVMTKEQLQNAPKFEESNRGSGAGTTGTTGTGTTGTGTTAPRP